MYGPSNEPLRFLTNGPCKGAARVPLGEQALQRVVRREGGRGGAPPSLALPGYLSSQTFSR